MKPGLFDGFAAPLRAHRGGSDNGTQPGDDFSRARGFARVGVKAAIDIAQNIHLLVTPGHDEDRHRTHVAHGLTDRHPADSRQPDIKEDCCGLTVAHDDGSNPPIGGYTRDESLSLQVTGERCSRLGTAYDDENAMLLVHYNFAPRSSAD